MLKQYPAVANPLHVRTTGFLIRFLAWTKLAQAKLWVSHCSFDCSSKDV